MATPRLHSLSRRLTTITTTVTSSLIPRSLSSAAIPPPQFSLLYARFAVRAPLTAPCSARLFSIYHAPIYDDYNKRYRKESTLENGRDFKHSLIFTDSPPQDWSRDQVIDFYVKTLAQVVGSEEKARTKIYCVSTKHYLAFGALILEELANKFKEMECIKRVHADSYQDVKKKDYGGEPFINGKAVPYHPKYHELLESECTWKRRHARITTRIFEARKKMD